MVLGTRISGLSLGAPRTLSFAKPSLIWTGKPTYDMTVDPINLRLTSGSLYVMNPPTRNGCTLLSKNQPSKKLELALHSEIIEDKKTTMVNVVSFTI